MNKNRKTILNITISAISLALTMVLPLITANIPQVGKLLLPMHLPVIICGFICGWKYGLLVGAIAPILRYLIFGMPVLYPSGIGMSFELAAYGFVSGMLFNVFSKLRMKLMINTYITLIIALISGRLVWGIVRYTLTLIDHSLKFTFKMFITGAIMDAWLGIIIQIIIIPLMVIALSKNNYILNRNQESD